MDTAPKKSLAQLRSEVKELRKALYKPISRSKKSDLESEIARHKGISSPSSTKSEAVAVPMVPKEEQPKKEKAEKQGKKAETKKIEKKETKSDKVKEPKEKKSKTVKKEKKSE